MRRRDLLDLLLLLGWCAALVVAWLALGALFCVGMDWVAGPARGAPVPRARPAKAAPSLAGSWWLSFSPDYAYECCLCADGFAAIRVWDAHGPTALYVGEWRVDGGTLHVKEHRVLECGHVAAWESKWSAEVARLRRTR